MQIRDNAGGVPDGDGDTHTVGAKKPNTWGLYDMYGNVFELRLDDWAGSLPGGAVTDPRSPAAGASTADRGGSYASHAKDCRSAFRGY